MNDERKNLEFEIAWCEDNLRYLAGEPESESKKLCIQFNTDRIAECKRLLKQKEE